MDFDFSLLQRNYHQCLHRHWFNRHCGRNRIGVLVKKYFGITRNAFLDAPRPFPSEKYFREKVLEKAGNVEVIHVSHPFDDNWAIILQCKYKPEDFPLWGWYWEQLPPEMFGWIR